MQAFQKMQQFRDLFSLPSARGQNAMHCICVCVTDERLHMHPHELQQSSHTGIPIYHNRIYALQANCHQNQCDILRHLCEGKRGVAPVAVQQVTVGGAAVCI